MKLADIVSGCGVVFDAGVSLDTDITAVTSDSRAVGEGTLFIALKGYAVDGHTFIAQAIARGARAVLANTNYVHTSDPSVVVGRVADTRRIYSRVLANFYRDPSCRLKVIGVTGTNGKTTTTFLLNHILRPCGGSGVIGTVHAIVNDETVPLDNTTPDMQIVTSLMDRMVSKGLKYCAMEVSSHALDQRRIDGCNFAARIFTNLTQDHLDYHKDFESYFASKKLLFTKYSPAAVSIINVDDSYGARLYNEVSGTKVSFGIVRDADVRASNVVMNADGFSCDITASGRTMAIRSTLPCLHNVYNVLGAVAAALAMGVNASVIESQVATFTGVPGRMERVNNQYGVPVFVDYAHTPDAFNNVLSGVRKVFTGDIITVFGCGGDRDTTKRPLMGKSAVEYSDQVIVTNDNPRTEDPQHIVGQICAGIVEAGMEHKCQIVLDRAKAIRKACQRAREVQGLVLVLGKGHEDYQIFGKQKVHFSDQEEVAKAFTEMTVTV